MNGPEMSKRTSSMDAEAQRSFAAAADFDRWLKASHASCTGLWVRVARKGSGKKSVTYPEALEVALAWGWIDALKRGLDDAEWLQRFTPRAPRSPWSKINCAKAEALIEAKRMKPPGLAEVERAKRDGRWERAYEGQGKAELPTDFAEALAPQREGGGVLRHARRRQPLRHRP
jgi:uncharacterized protein YdeI (YjbR/CyaY-like superfamily)